MKNAVSLTPLRFLVIAFVLLAASPAFPQVTNPAAVNAVAALPEWLTRPLSLVDAINIALNQNATIVKGRKDLEAAYGVVMQIRAIALPKIGFSGEYANTDQKDKIESPNFSVDFSSDHRWNMGIRVVQSIYEGGRIRSSLRTANLTKEEALLAYQSVISDTLTEVRITYYDVQQAAQQILVQEAAVTLRTKELEDTTRRYEAGTVPKFNVLRSEVELANVKPRLIRARNAHRIAKNNLANLLGYNLPKEVWEDIPLQLSDKMTPQPFDIELPMAIGKALELRPELGVLRKVERIQKEAITSAKSGYLPKLDLYAGYGARKSQFSGGDLTAEIHGYEVGAQAIWNIWDGNLTRGRVREARALHEKSEVDLDDAARRIELEVRTAYSLFVEAKEVLETQKKVLEQGEEALRLANSRYDAGTGTQLDVLAAESSLTEARSTNVQALRDYGVALFRLERAVGLSLPENSNISKYTDEKK